eukprot:TRINITY_DN3697_c0_g1_i4.p1 TRINITY_DN3697_c0_g1~~TRINITY_DN3697_c0_g1_i4.p1  ORF type:complete len:2404 (-),score=413.62 TRINITY_DN3697_c0_g1_i4:118-7329(-)
MYLKILLALFFVGQGHEVVGQETCDDCDHAVELLQVSLQTESIQAEDDQDKGDDLTSEQDPNEATTRVTECPSDWEVSAKAAWEAFFLSQCKVAAEDVPPALTLSFDQQAGFAEVRETFCTAVVPYQAHPGNEFHLSVDLKPGPNPSDQGWEVVPDSESLLMLGSSEGPVSKDQACSHLFGVGVPRVAFLPEGRVQQVFQQVQSDYVRACGAGDDMKRYEISLVSDISTGLTARRGLTDSQGKAMFSLHLSVEVAGGGFPEDLKIFAEEDPPSEEENDDEYDMEQAEAFERQSLATAEANGENISFLQVLKPDMNQQEQDDKEYNRALANAPTSSKEPKEKKSPRLPKKRPKDDPIGKLRVLDDMTLPMLCCLCGSCEDNSVCTSFADGGTNPTSLLDESSFVKPKRSPSAPAIGSEAESKPLPRLLHPNVARKNAGVHRPRFRAAPGYGDNFHSTVLAQRTADDHRRVWAQSRALVHTVAQENIDVPESFHFFDDDDRAKCWRPAYQQGECGSCWAFASLGALEKQICMRARGAYAPTLAREMLVRCSEQNGACEGGNADKAYEDLMEIGGVWGTDCLPYQGKGVKHCPVFSYSWFGQGSAGQTGNMARIDQEIQKSCQDLTRFTNRPPMGKEWDLPFTMMYESRFNGLPDGNDTRLQRWKRGFAKSRARDRVPSWWLYGEAAMKAAIAKYGSIYASYIAMNDFKNRQCNTGCWPPGTVWGEEAEFRPSDCGCPKNGHAIQIIGYGTDIQEEGNVRVPYWLIENSWGAEAHGDILGEDAQGVKGFGPDPFTELHPMGIEDQCVLAGWYASSLPRTGGCGGNAGVNIRDDLPISGGDADGFNLAVEVDGTVVLEQAVKEDSNGMFMTNVSLAPGNHSVKFLLYAKNHPIQQGLHLEKYMLSAVSVRCRGRGYGYSFTKNDAKAQLSWGRATRRELREQADALLTEAGVDVNAKLEDCPADCRTGRYSLVKPCEGLLLDWGSCYTQDYVYTHDWYLSRKKADCRNCTAMARAQKEQALATQALNSTTFIQWHELVQQAFDAPDEPGWSRQFLGSCQLESRGHNKNTQMTASYDLTVPNGADGNGGCDERNSAFFVQGKFVNAPGPMASGTKATQRCPMPLKGEVQLTCDDGVLRAASHTCEERAALGDLAPDVQEAKRLCMSLPKENCTDTCAWDSLSGCDIPRRGYFKIVRGYNYHGIEDGAAFAIAEMSRFLTLCPTTGWSKWSACSAKVPCTEGTQTRTRDPAGEFTREHPGCAEVSFNESRPCVAPGFCPQVHTRFLQSGGAEVDQALAAYKRQSTTLPYGTAGAHIMQSAYPTCQEAEYWCRLITGSSPCDMLFSGNFEVKKSGNYYLRYSASSGGGQIEFNTLGSGEEGKPEYLVRAGTSGGQSFVWQDLGFHHRRRRTGVKPWSPVTSIRLERGTYFARMTRTGWTGCPDFSLTLEEMSSTYSAPILLGGGVAGTERDELGGARQKKVRWNNKWGSMQSWYVNNRGRYSSYAPEWEEGASNEILVRDAGGGTVYGKATVSKMNFTADELYTLLKLDKTNPPGRSYQTAEFVIRASVVIPEKGEYKFRYQTDSSSDDTNPDWRSASRRRQQKFTIRANMTNQQAVEKRQGSATSEVTLLADEAGTATFEVSHSLDYDGVSNKMALPNFVDIQIKEEDVLHRGARGSLDFGSHVAHVSELEALRGDTDVRGDWPDRDDPFSSELRTATFKEVMHNELLIGKSGLGAFMADVEGKIDAGACLGLEARVPAGTEVAAEGFAGLSLELCDIDGANQYLELAKLTGVNSTRSRIGWVHIGFTQPTHLRLRRDPDDFGKFEVSYRPDDRLEYATPFAVESLVAAAAGYDGEMEVGVTMMTPESYRYAEFYNVSVEECPTTCEEGGKQVLCGKITTACGTVLECPGKCGAAGDVCHDNQCMACPTDGPPADMANAQCGSYQQICTNPKGQMMQVDRVLDTMPRPTVNHFCMNGTWKCEGRKKWSYMAEGKECGEVTDECGELVRLFDCPRTNDECQDFKCVCSPATFDGFECGWEPDGCGRNVTFGGQGDGTCPGATQRCLDHQCCTPKTKEAYPNFQCGQVSDGCDGFLYFQREGVQETPFFPDLPSSTTGTHSGEKGTQFQANQDFKISSLGRGLTLGQVKLQESTTISLWSLEGEKLLASAVVGPDSIVQNGYAYAQLPTHVAILQGGQYVITLGLTRNSLDKLPTDYRRTARTSSFATFQGERMGFRQGEYPKYGPYRNRGYGAINFGVVENDGCGAFPWECSNNTCTEKKITGFTVNEGECKLTDGGNCVTSPNYPSHYGSSQSCTILPPPGSAPIEMKYFNTESGFDKLFVNGQAYQGAIAEGTTVTTSSEMTWTSDGSVQRKGWKLCVQGAAGLLQKEAEGVGDEPDEEDPAKATGTA